LDKEDTPAQVIGKRLKLLQFKRATLKPHLIKKLRNKLLTPYQKRVKKKLKR
jgi:septum formation topological specificity factor MinE